MRPWWTPPSLTASRESLHTILPENELDLPVHVLVVNRFAFLKVDSSADLKGHWTFDIEGLESCS